jgi:four helix bundle protein
VANIAEGAGRRTRADAGRHYFIARGSAMESASHLDVMTAMAIIDAERYRRGIELLEGVVAMLTKVALGVVARQTPARPAPIVPR